MSLFPNGGAAQAKAAIFLLLGALLATDYLVQAISAQIDQKRFAGPTSSQPLALSADGRLLIAANPDNDTVSIFDVQYDNNRRLAEIKVQSEPNGVAITPDGTFAYVANTAMSLTPGPIRCP
jgi:YVTN family beta-propeller protein